MFRGEFPLLVAVLLFKWVFGQECGSNVTEPSGLVQSPYWYESHNKMMTCTFSILAEEYYVIELEFTKMDMDESSICLYESLMVFDGDIQVGRFCGKTLPPPYRSVSRNVTFFLDVGGAIGKGNTGFNASYTQVVGQLCGTMEVSSFGLLRSLEDGEIGEYNCSWELKTTPDKIFQVYILEVDTPYYTDNECMDSDMYFDVSSEDYDVLCASVEDTGKMLSFNINVIWVDFLSYTNETAGTFSLIYSTTDKNGECGGILTNDTGIIQSVDRDGDGKFDNNLNCIWVIVAPNGTRIELKFLDFDMHGTIDCIYDFVQVLHFHDGNYVHVPGTGRMCGDTIPKTILSDSNVVYVQFGSDALWTARGFKLLYRFMEELPEATTTSVGSSTSTDVTPSTRARIMLAEGGSGGNKPEQRNHGNNIVYVYGKPVFCFIIHGLMSIVMTLKYI